MKKIISHRYFIIVFLLVIADQKFSVLVLRSDLVAGLSDFAYYLSDMMLNFLVVLFGVSHISNHGWVLTDFVFYMGGGLIFAVLFRMTKSIYWPIGLHIVYNGIGQLLMLL
ncbi:putative metal-dependent membrane protease [Streptococcus pneumoniae]|nr:putative metal-dependent membrane protease [Streptococcus pneumoniae]VSM67348.1 putative metal-dependent membrane protease [Streptococcus pneumoniae]HEU8871219.1 CPBP family intramembrane metalloprotease [Streptococcus pneumoniae]